MTSAISMIKCENSLKGALDSEKLAQTWAPVHYEIENFHQQTITLQ